MLVLSGKAAGHVALSCPPSVHTPCHLPGVALPLTSFSSDGHTVPLTPVRVTTEPAASSVAKQGPVSASATGTGSAEFRQLSLMVCATSKGESAVSESRTYRIYWASNPRLSAEARLGAIC